MSRCINQLGLGLVALVLMVFMALPASAQAAGWQPKFDAGQHVYVDPALANHASYPVNLSGLSKQLETVSDKHGVSVYVVAIERTTEGGAVPAVGRVNDLVLRWQGQADFPHDRFLVILWLRYADDPSQGSVAVNAGSELRQYNLTSSDLNSPSGPVNAAIKKYMPHDPNGAFVAIVQNVNSSIESVKSQRFFWSISPFILIGLVALGVGAFFYRKRKASYDELKTAYDKVAGNWQAMMDSANALHVRLHEGYMGFLSQQSDWKKMLKGSTLAQFTEAVKLFADFSSRLAKANAVFAEANAKAAQGGVFSPGNLAEAKAMLTSTVIVVEGKELPIEEATLFGGLVERSEYKPDELLNAMDVLFAQTNRQLNAIKLAMEDAQQKSRQLKDSFAVINDIKARAGADFASFEEKYTELEQAKAAIDAEMTSDPIKVADELTGLLSRTRQFKAQLETRFAG